MSGYYPFLKVGADIDKLAANPHLVPEAKRADAEVRRKVSQGMQQYQKEQRVAVKQSRADKNRMLEVCTPCMLNPNVYAHL